jgi:hypothetical protein
MQAANLFSVAELRRPEVLPVAPGALGCFLCRRPIPGEAFYAPVACDIEGHWSLDGRRPFCSPPCILRTIRDDRSANSPMREALLHTYVREVVGTKAPLVAAPPPALLYAAPDLFGVAVEEGSALDEDGALVRIADDDAVLRQATNGGNHNIAAGLAGPLRRNKPLQFIASERTASSVVNRTAESGDSLFKTFAAQQTRATLAGQQAFLAQIPAEKGGGLKRKRAPPTSKKPEPAAAPPGEGVFSFLKAKTKKPA